VLVIYSGIITNSKNVFVHQVSSPQLSLRQKMAAPSPQMHG